MRVAVSAMAVALCGCQDLTAKLPADAVDPGFYKTAEAAQRMARNTRYEFQMELLKFIANSGGFSDEFRWRRLGDPIGSWELATALDSRQVPENGIPEVSSGGWEEAFGGYKGLQRIRSIALQARSALQAYAPDTPPALRAEMLAYEAMAVIMLADLFCSGVPLTTVDFEGDFTYRAGSSTEELYTHATALLDTAIRWSEADPGVNNMARLAKGRALLALGLYDDAGIVVSSVPSGYARTLLIAVEGLNFETAGSLMNWWQSFWQGSGEGELPDPTRSEVGNIASTEGGNGLPFLTAGDPRIRVDSHTVMRERTNRHGLKNYFPAVRTELIITNHIEARLIQAEAALQAGRSEWIDLLNVLRTDRAYTLHPISGDTLWKAGTGGVAGLGPLSDPATAGPGADTSRVNLLFRERAFWLFATGRRQGDLRRLVRHYHRPIDKTYPYGTYGGGDGFYGDFIDLPLPRNERYNPYVSGCMARGA